MKHNSYLRFFSLFLAASLLLSGCGLVALTEGGTLLQETHSLDLDSAEHVAVDISMQLGELILHSSDTRLLEGTFQYNVADWKPSVEYTLADQRGELRITQPGKVSNLVKNGENTWDLSLGSSVPLALAISVGAGVSRLDLTRLELTRLSLDTGVGDVDLDLRGDWAHDLDVTISAGVGEVTIHLPEAIGARIEVDNGLGKLHRSGVSKQGSAYVNDAYGSSPHTLHITISSGAGTVNLEG